MDEEIAWYLAGLLLSWALGWGAGALHTKLVQIFETSSQ